LLIGPASLNSEHQIYLNPWECAKNNVLWRAESPERESYMSIHRLKNMIRIGETISAQMREKLARENLCGAAAVVQ